MIMVICVYIIGLAVVLLCIRYAVMEMITYIDKKLTYTYVDDLLTDEFSDDPLCETTIPEFSIIYAHPFAICYHANETCTGLNLALCPTHTY